MSEREVSRSTGRVIESPHIAQEGSSSSSTAMSSMVPYNRVLREKLPDYKPSTLQATYDYLT